MDGTPRRSCPKKKMKKRPYIRGPNKGMADDQGKLYLAERESDRRIVDRCSTVSDELGKKGVNASAREMKWEEQSNAQSILAALGAREEEGKKRVPRKKAHGREKRERTKGYRFLPSEKKERKGIHGRKGVLPVNTRLR